MSSPLTANPADDGWAGIQAITDTFANMRAHAGSIKRSQPDGTNEAIALRCNGTSFDLFRRALFSTDISSIDIAATITSGYYNLFVNSVTTTLSGQSLTLCNGGPSSNTLIANGDYEGNVSNNTIWGDTVAISSLTTSAYNKWNLNATGIAGVQAALGGYFKSQLKFECDRVNSAPTCSGTNLANMNWNFGNAASNKSQLVIAYTLGGGHFLTTFGVGT